MPTHRDVFLFSQVGRSLWWVTTALSLLERWGPQGETMPVRGSTWGAGIYPRCNRPAVKLVVSMATSLGTEHLPWPHGDGPGCPFQPLCFHLCTFPRPHAVASAPRSSSCLESPSCPVHLAVHTHPSFTGPLKLQFLCEALLPPSSWFWGRLFPGQTVARCPRTAAPFISLVFPTRWTSGTWTCPWAPFHHSQTLGVGRPLVQFLIFILEMRKVRPRERKWLAQGPPVGDGVQTRTQVSRLPVQCPAHYTKLLGAAFRLGKWQLDVKPPGTVGGIGRRPQGNTGASKEDLLLMVAEEEVRRKNCYNPWFYHVKNRGADPHPGAVFWGLVLSV